jgi:lysophospholipase L1-like esterase
MKIGFILYYYLFFLILFFLLGCTKDESSSQKVPDQKITGETFVLNELEENNLIKKGVNNLKLYSIDNNRNKIYYKENVDYVVSNNRVRRTNNSTIPNFKEHRVVFNSNDTFTFNSSPRNPSLTIPFQVYADYDFYDYEYITADFNATFLSSKLKDKLRRKEQIKIGAIGTSITAGAHTLENFYHNSDKDSYPYLLGKAISKLYNTDVLVTNYSQGGSTIGYLETISPTVLHDGNDLVLIEFGMNDHLYNWWESGLSNFELKIVTAIENFQAQNIDVVLVGFFQQNSSWDSEFRNSTITYNQKLYDLAKKYNCYFADIYKEFSKYNQTKINQDLCGDFLHHPTSFGHLLYYKTIIPVFLEKEVNDGFVYSLVK